MARYEYPTMDGYWWNAIQKISIDLGININDISMSSDGVKVYIDFPIELALEQKTTLDNLMENNPCSPNISKGTTFRICDLWGMRQWFNTQFGITPIYWFSSENEEGSGNCFIYLNFPSGLTNEEKQKIIDTYQATIEELI